MKEILKNVQEETRAALLLGFLPLRQVQEIVSLLCIQKLIQKR